MSARDHVVLYDDDCGFCKWSLDKVLAWDRHDRVRPVAIQSPEGQELLSGVPPDRRLDSWHLVAPSGQVHSAGPAAAPLARVLPGGRPLAALFERFPAATDRAYRFVADHRTWFGRRLGIADSCQLKRG
jgi:predicted DCC family thiol-disulfide oxidoreductase YuxK